MMDDKWLKLEIFLECFINLLNVFMEIVFCDDKWKWSVLIKV